MPKVVECVPNFSEGRDQKVLHFHVLTKYVYLKFGCEKKLCFSGKVPHYKKKAITTTFPDDGNVIFILYKTLLSHLILYVSI